MMKLDRRTLLPLAAAALLLGFLWILAPSPAPRISCAALLVPPTIVAFGDSLVVGEGASVAGGFVTLLSERTGVRIHNYGRSGDTTMAARARVPQVLRTEPDIVLVLLGGNDALRRIPVETTKQNLTATITDFKESGAQVILLGVMGGVPLRDPYRTMFEALADEHQVSYVPNVLSGLIGRSDYMSDAVHPNDAGYAIIAERVQPVLEEACAQEAS